MRLLVALCMIINLTDANQRPAIKTRGAAGIRQAGRGNACHPSCRSVRISTPNLTSTLPGRDTTTLPIPNFGCEINSPSE